MTFKSVSSQVNFPEHEKEILSFWYDQGVVNKYLTRNANSNTKFSFLDGPITANNPMGVHHAWGRTYKDLWQRYFSLRGFNQRHQNGFDCQGLWVEVEVEKELGFKTKKDIETYGVANFVNKCKERVLKYASIQTQQSQRLGYFMDWNNSYFTMSDENNYAIWHFLKVCHARNWIYKGHDSVPWCPRCETAISQHEMLTEDYKEATHETVFFKLPVKDHDFSLIAWTTTPWTIPANVALAVNPEFTYRIWKLENGDKVVTLKPDQIEDPEQKSWFDKHVISAGMEELEDIPGSQLIGLSYTGPFDHLPRVQSAHKENPSTFHTVVAAPDLVVASKGTGILHVAPGAGQEDFELSKSAHLPVISVIADNADYLAEMNEFTGQNAKKHPEIIIDYLRSHENGKFLYKTAPITHRYPACWRCKAELVWKIADEWYISMDKPDPTDDKKRTLREQMMDVARQINWLPEFGLDRELDWLRNMHDWLISKKNRYWGLALPIYECNKCSHFQVIGSRDELQSRATSGWSEFAGNSPHRPWIDAVKIKCRQCGDEVSRILDVGNPWLDAGIVPFSTLPEGWFPADFITESFPGQFKNWFYSLIAMSTVLKKTHPFKTVLGFATMVDSLGHPFHKSAGNAIEFVEGADKFGADVIRWVCTSSNPAQNINFGQKEADETRRRFHLMLWNIYNFFITYANIDDFGPKLTTNNYQLSTLDRWILARLSQTTIEVTQSLDRFNAQLATTSIEHFVSDLSLWYVRRSRDRVGPSATNADDKNACHATLYQVLLTLSQLLAPFTPFMSESIYQNLTLGEKSFTDSSVSVHLADWPQAQEITSQDEQLISQMSLSRKVVEKALSARKDAGIKVRQPLASLTYSLPDKLSEAVESLIAAELNVKQIKFQKSDELSVVLDTALTPQLLAEGEARELVRSFQELRKKNSLKPQELVAGFAPSWPQEHEEYIRSQAMLSSLTQDKEIRIQ